MKTLRCTANESVPGYMTYYKEGWHCTTILMILWNQEINIQTSLGCCVYVFECHSNTSHLTDPLECHANSYKRIETTGS